MHRCQRPQENKKPRSNLVAARLCRISIANRSLVSSCSKRSASDRNYQIKHRLLCQQLELEVHQQLVLLLARLEQRLVLEQQPVPNR